MNNFQGPVDRRPKVLLVDDEVAVRDLLHKLFESAGYDVLEASNGLDGLDVYRQTTPPIELLVTDYNMPDMSGLELARECSRLCSELGVLYVSGSGPDEELLADLQMRKRSFLAKPFDGGDVLRVAKALLQDETNGQSAIA